MKKEKKTPKPPQMSPYVFTFLLLAFGAWCFYDGFLTSDPEMMEHATFNRVLSGILLPWGVYDFFKMKKREKKAASRKENSANTDSPENKDNSEQT